MKIRGRLSLASILLVTLLAACHSGSDAKPVPEIWNLYSGRAGIRRCEDAGRSRAAPGGLGATGKGARNTSPAKWRKRAGKSSAQEFDDETPRGTVKFCNLIARFGDDHTTQQVIICSHYDTKLFDTIRFVGASDGGSSTGALIEMARTLAQDPGLARRVELVFFDGEEAVVQFTETDGLYGSRYYAKALRDSGRYQQFKFGVLWDMMGPKNLDITLSPDSPPDLVRGILERGRRAELRQDFTFFDNNIYDDHVPLLHIAEVPTIDLIDFNYPPWHTAADTLDKLWPEQPRGRRRGDTVLPATTIPERMKTITRAELKELLDAGGPHVLIDVTPEEYYRAAHLPGAKNCCVYEVTFVDQAAAAAPDKQTPVIVYGSSGKLARLDHRAGETRTRRLRAGAGLPRRPGRLVRRRPAGRAWRRRCPSRPSPARAGTKSTSRRAA